MTFSIIPVFGVYPHSANAHQVKCLQCNTQSDIPKTINRPAAPRILVITVSFTVVQRLFSYSLGKPIHEQKEMNLLKRAPKRYSRIRELDFMSLLDAW